MRYVHIFQTHKHFKAGGVERRKGHKNTKICKILYLNTYNVDLYNTNIVTLRLHRYLALD